jgi:hypothetical protein
MKYHHVINWPQKKHTKESYLSLLMEPSLSKSEMRSTFFIVSTSVRRTTLGTDDTRRKGWGMDETMFKLEAFLFIHRDQLDMQLTRRDPLLPGAGQGMKRHRHVPSLNASGHIAKCA